MPPSGIPSQTPLFHAINKDRYARQQLIKNIEKKTKRQLLVYIANLQHPNGGIEQSDVIAFGDLLQNAYGSDIDLLLQSPGGDIDVAEKIIYMCRKAANGFRVIVAESAKSAATLIALAADEILMSHTSELGPIDPQVSITTASGEQMSRPAQSFLDGLKSIQEEVAKSGGKLSPVYFPLLQQLDPALIDFCRKATQRSRQFAEKWLKRYQCKNDPAKAKRIAKKLADTERYLSHGTIIDHEEAAKVLELKVKYLRPKTLLWQAIWHLYCSYEADMRSKELAKIFESSSVSLPFK